MKYFIVLFVAVISICIVQRADGQFYGQLWPSRPQVPPQPAPAPPPPPSPVQQPPVSLPQLGQLLNIPQQLTNSVNQVLGGILGRSVDTLNIFQRIEQILSRPGALQNITRPPSAVPDANVGAGVNVDANVQVT